VDSILIEIPHLPSMELSSNNRSKHSHWGTFHEAMVADKELAHAYIRNQTHGNAALPWDKAKVTITVHRPDSRRVDVDNVVSSLKGFIDALKGLVIEDDSATIVPELTVRVEIKSGRAPLTEIVVEKL
jgi:hypothetical protein